MSRSNLSSHSVFSKQINPYSIQLYCICFEKRLSFEQIVNIVLPFRRRIMRRTLFIETDILHLLFQNEGTSLLLADIFTSCFGKETIKEIHDVSLVGGPRIG